MSLIMGTEGDVTSKTVGEEIGDIPKELALQPLPCVAFLGLNLNNKHHINIWNSFACNRQSDRISLYYKVLTAKNPIIPCKPKKSSYEWHIPKGILKSNWLQKHLFEVPSVVVLFVDLDWNEPNWEAASNDCAAKVELLKRQLHGRSTRIALVLIQENLSLPGDDSLATERAAHLCGICDLSPKSLFVLPLTDPHHFIGYVLRMETAIFELAKSYYQYEAKMIKTHKELLNKTTHQLLFVRHMFKIAFLNEIKQEIQTAVKGYKQAYAYLMEVRVSVTNLLEIKTIAGFINYKICKLLFLQNEPMDAFSQFRKHIDIFKSKSEPKELQFEHSIWLSKQFYILGELFEQSIAAGLVPSQTQHPGYYYYEAALQCIKRKKYCSKITEILTDEQYNAITKKFLPQEFYGQRQWRPGCQSLEPLDIQLEKEGIRALQYKEVKFVNHSSIIILILTNAVAQFKKHKCPRMTRYIMALIAQEYYSNRDYNNALVFLNQILPFYRIEKWKPILTSLLKIALNAAYLSANSAEFVKFGLEFISSWNGVDENEKKIVQDSIDNVLTGNPPLQLNIYDNDLFNFVSGLWRNELESREQQILTLNMNVVIPFVEIKPVFSSSTVSVDDKVKLSVVVKTNCPQTIQFSKLKVIFTHQYYNDFCVLSDESSEENKLCFEPSVIRSIDFVFDVHSSDIGKMIQIAGICLYYGKLPLVVALSWSFANDPILRKEKLPWHDLKDRNDDFAQITAMPLINVINRTANIHLEIELSLPALIDEDCDFKIIIRNNEEKPIHRLRLSVDRVAGCPSNLLHSITSDSTVRCLGEDIFIVDCLSLNATTEKIISLRFSSVGIENLKFTVKYELDSETEIDVKQFRGVCSTSQDIEVESIYPFTCFFTTFNIRRNTLNYIRVLEPFIIKVNLKPLSCHSIFVESIILEPNYFTAVMDSENTKSAYQSVCGNVLNADGNSEIEYVVYCTQEVLNSLTLGTLVIKWRRNSTMTQVNETKILMPEVIVQKSILYVECSLPEFGITRQHFQFKCIIYNRTNETLPLELSMENSDNFMYSGNKQIKFEIAAHQHCKQYYIFYPLVCGFVSLPKLRLVAYPDTNRAIPMDQFLEGLLPTSLQILPQEKVLSTKFDKIVVI